MSNEDPVSVVASWLVKKTTEEPACGPTVAATPCDELPIAPHVGGGVDPDVVAQSPAILPQVGVDGSLRFTLAVGAGGGGVGIEHQLQKRRAYETALFGEISLPKEELDWIQVDAELSTRSKSTAHVTPRVGGMGLVDLRNIWSTAALAGTDVNDTGCDGGGLNNGHHRQDDGVWSVAFGSQTDTTDHTVYDPVVRITHRMQENTQLWTWDPITNIARGDKGLFWEKVVNWLECLRSGLADASKLNNTEVRLAIVANSMRYAKWDDVPYVHTDRDVRSS